MIRSIILFFFCLASYTALCQDETVMLTAEKASEWIKVELPVATRITRSSGTTVKKATRSRSQTSNRQSVPQPATPKDDFDKTNNKVNRFKKG
jgi:hypothetical protein